MKNESEPAEIQSDQNQKTVEGLLWFLLCLLLVSVGIVLMIRNWDKIEASFNSKRIENYDSLIVTNGFHDIQIENGQSWDLSYETNHSRFFSGLVRHISIIDEPSFAILSHDILVTSGDFSNPELVSTSVSNHHFTWVSSSLSNPAGTINLLHTLPMDENIRMRLDAIKDGDNVQIKGWDIYRIEGYDTEGSYIGYWKDSGCNTILVTEVRINPSGTDGLNSEKVN